MNRILLVARRDFLQIVSTRAFKITLLIVPLMLGLAIQQVPHFCARPRQSPMSWPMRAATSRR